MGCQIHKSTIMKTTIRKILTLTLLLLMATVLGCENFSLFKGDYRKKYYGDYSFTMIIENWRMDTATWYDTVLTEGEVRKYETADSENDIFSQNDSEMDSDKRITIELEKGNPFITPVIDENGLFVPLYGYHYLHEGLFTDQDHLSFSVRGLGGLGGGTNYFITGVRKL